MNGWPAIATTRRQRRYYRQFSSLQDLPDHLGPSLPHESLGFFLAIFANIELPMFQFSGLNAGHCNPNRGTAGALAVNKPIHTARFAFVQKAPASRIDP